MTFYRRPPPSEIPPKPPEVDKPPYGTWLAIILAGVILIWLLRPTHVAKKRTDDWATKLYGPKIVLIANGQPFQYKGCTITPLATFSLRARVLSLAYYYNDKASMVSPVDFAVGWGEMSDLKIANAMNITQVHRFVKWRFDPTKGISHDYLKLHSRNIHIIPSTPQVAEIVNRVSKNDFIMSSGYLVSVSCPNGFQFDSNLKLDTKTGPGVCFLLWLEKLEIL